MSLELAISTALQAHLGQIDEDGFPHIVHAMGVMAITQRELESQHIAGYTNEEILIAAVLHDTVEDSNITLEYIRHIFGERVAEIVDAITRRKDESYRDFIYRAKANPAARLIKIADLLHNRGRMHKISKKKASWAWKLGYKYSIASDVLNAPWEPTWEGASFEHDNGRYFIADPNGKRIEITQEEAKDTRMSFRVSN